jgi:hypothetical protein
MTEVSVKLRLTTVSFNNLNSVINMMQPIKGFPPAPKNSSSKVLNIHASDKKA